MRGKEWDCMALEEACVIDNNRGGGRVVLGHWSLVMGMQWACALDVTLVN